MKLAIATISLATAATSVAQSVGATPQSEFSIAFSEYGVCIDKHIRLFEPAKESAGDTVDAALAACKTERARLVSAIWQVQKTKRPDFTILDSEESFNTMIKEQFRQDALVSLMKMRAGISE